MLEMLKKAEEVLKKFKSLPKEQRYYYDESSGEVMFIELIDSISIEHDSKPLYCLKGYVADNGHRWWSKYFHDLDSLVTKEEAMKQAEKDIRKLEKNIERVKDQRESLKCELEDLENKLKNMKGHNKC